MVEGSGQRACPRHVAEWHRNGARIGFRPVAGGPLLPARLVVPAPRFHRHDMAATLAPCPDALPVPVPVDDAPVRHELYVKVSI